MVDHMTGAAAVAAFVGLWIGCYRFAVWADRKIKRIAWAHAMRDAQAAEQQAIDRARVMLDA